MRKQFFHYYPEISLKYHLIWLTERTTTLSVNPDNSVSNYELKIFEIKNIEKKIDPFHIHHCLCPWATHRNQFLKVQLFSTDILKCFALI